MTEQKDKKSEAAAPEDREVLKAGDRIRYEGTWVQMRGEIGTVTEPGKFLSEVKMDRFETVYTFNNRGLVKIPDELKEGDRVRYSGPVSKFQGRTGKLMDAHFHKSALVRFDSERTPFLVRKERLVKIDDDPTFTPGDWVTYVGPDSALRGAQGVVHGTRPDSQVTVLFNGYNKVVGVRSEFLEKESKPEVETVPVPVDELKRISTLSGLAQMKSSIKALIPEPEKPRYVLVDLKGLDLKKMWILVNELERSGKDGSHQLGALLSRIDTQEDDALEEIDEVVNSPALMKLIRERLDLDS